MTSQGTTGVLEQAGGNALNGAHGFNEGRNSVYGIGSEIARSGTAFVSEDLLGRWLPCLVTASHSPNAGRPGSGAGLGSTRKRAEAREAPARKHRRGVSGVSRHV